MPTTNFWVAAISAVIISTPYLLRFLWWEGLSFLRTMQAAVFLWGFIAVVAFLADYMNVSAHAAH